MHAAVRGNAQARSQITVLLFINLDSSKSEALYSVLFIVHEKWSKSAHINYPGQMSHNSHFWSTKADDIMAASQEVDSTIVRLGGFHVVMSYMEFI